MCSGLRKEMNLLSVVLIAAAAFDLDLQIGGHTFFILINREHELCEEYSMLKLLPLQLLDKILVILHLFSE